jgi:hypothetical protein
MTVIDAATLRSTLQLLREDLALKIAENIGSGDSPAPDGYAASNHSSQSIAQTLAGLRLPTTSPDPLDRETIQSLLKNFVTLNPATVQTASLSSAVAAALAQTSDTLPADVATEQGVAKEDAAQLTATAVAVNRFQKGETAPFQQVTGGASRSELWEGSKAPNAALAGDLGTSSKASTASTTSVVTQPSEQPLSATIAKHEAATNLQDNLQNVTVATASSHVDQTGIIPSFILNAAMLPGWPVPNQAALAEFVAKTKISEEEMFKQLANMGASSELIEKLKKKKPRVTKKLLVYLAMLLTAVETVIGTVADELAMLSGEEKNFKEDRERANPRGHTGSRQHVYIE